jgi:hypothetical protein
LKREVLEIGAEDGWDEESEDFQAGLVMLASLSIDNRDPMAISQFTGVPLPLVREFSGRLIENGIWRPDGKTAGNWFDPEEGGFAFMLDVWVAMGSLERKSVTDGDVEPAGDESGSLSCTEKLAGERSDGQ